MFPSNYFGLFPPFPREDKVFVAMSFDEWFQPRWENVIEPAIRDVGRNDVRLEPHRVDTRRISDSILTEILSGITNDLLIFADVTSLGHIDERPSRNGNVMYEIGLAHAVRLPEEVLIFRSDSDQLLFDVANVRVNSYDPDRNPDVARQQLSEAILESLKEIKLKQHLAVKAAAQSLDFVAWSVLLHAGEHNEAPYFLIRTIAEMASYAENNAAISRLLALGALETDYVKLTPEHLGESDEAGKQWLKYKPTVFGKAILEYLSEEMLGSSPELQKLLEKRYQQNLGIQEGEA